MRIRILFTIALFSLFAFTVPATNQVTADHPSLVFETIDIGEISYYRYGDANFSGADLGRGNQVAWDKFWSRHTAGEDPLPPLPKIDFRKDMVFATILGHQTSGGGPRIRMLAIDTGHGCQCLQILIQDDETPGPLDVITNPFHIVKYRRGDVGSVIFEHQTPRHGDR